MVVIMQQGLDIHSFVVAYLDGKDRLGGRVVLVVPL